MMTEAEVRQMIERALDVERTRIVTAIEGAIHYACDYVHASSGIIGTLRELQTRIVDGY